MKVRGESSRLTSQPSGHELATALLTAPLITTLTTLLTAALLSLAAACILIIALTAWSLLPTLLTATLILITIVCHLFSSRCSKS
jgi:hypothetical protein